MIFIVVVTAAAILFDNPSGQTSKRRNDENNNGSQFTTKTPRHQDTEERKVVLGALVVNENVDASKWAVAAETFIAGVTPGTTRGPAAAPNMQPDRPPFGFFPLREAAGGLRSVRRALLGRRA